MKEKFRVTQSINGKSDEVVGFYKSYNDANDAIWEEVRKQVEGIRDYKITTKTISEEEAKLILSFDGAIINYALDTRH